MGNAKSVVFLSNNLTYHQEAFSDTLWKLTEGNYTFIETSEKARERQKLGQRSSDRPYVMVYWGNEEFADCLLGDADVVISGSAPERLVQKRVRSGKLLLRYSERPLKNGLEIWRYPDRFLRWNWRNPFWKPIYMLCASAYTTSDYRKFGLFKNKTYKWGYFPAARRYADPEAMIGAKDMTEIMWCGRFLELKHPDDALKVARRLKAEGYSFRMKFVGSGVMEKKLKQMVGEYELEEHVRFLGHITPDQVRTQMEKAGIYLFTSDRREGWGAVLNESMNSGCAVVASDAVGSAPYLVEDGKNGLIYPSGDVEVLYEKVKYLLERPAEQKRLGKAAYQTITEVWNAETAAERLLELAERLLKKERPGSPFLTGPCSRAD